MDNNHKIVMQFPLTSLWTDQEDILVQRGSYLSAENIQDILKIHPVEFVVADVGLKLQWINPQKTFDFWKTELKSHLVEDINKFYLDNFPDHYAYIASEWTGESLTHIILLEKYH